MKKKFIKIGLVSISDRATKGIYEDRGIPSLKEWLAHTLITPFETEEHIIPDELSTIQDTLKVLCDLFDLLEFGKFFNLIINVMNCVNTIFYIFLNLMNFSIWKLKLMGYWIK